MDDTAARVGWSDAQWSRIANVVTDEVSKASIAASMLSCYGTTSPAMDVVRREQVALQRNPYTLEVSVQDMASMPMWTLEVQVRLRREQVRDENLASAFLAFRRAANLLAMVEDAIVLHGGPLPRLPGMRARDRGPGAALAGRVARPEAGVVDEALVHAGGANNVAFAMLGVVQDRVPRPLAADSGDALVRSVHYAVRQLQWNDHSGPFACVLGHDALFAASEATRQAPALPLTRIEGILKGPVLRSSCLAADLGIVVAASAEPFDLVVGTPPQFQLLQIDAPEHYFFRVYERFVLRIKDPSAFYTIAL